MTNPKKVTTTKKKSIKKQTTYWDEIKNNETHFYGGNYGWEVHLLRQTYLSGPRGNEISKLEFSWPFSAGDGIPRAEKAKCRKDVLFARYKQKVLASASANKNEYYDLQGRIGNMSEEEFRAAIGNLQGFELRNYICNKYWTSAESYASFWRC